MRVTNGNHSGNALDCIITDIWEQKPNHNATRKFQSNKRIMRWWLLWWKCLIWILNMQSVELYSWKNKHTKCFYVQRLIRLCWILFKEKNERTEKRINWFGWCEWISRITITLKSYPMCAQLKPSLVRLFIFLFSAPFCLWIISISNWFGPFTYLRWFGF